MEQQTKTANQYTQFKDIPRVCYACGGIKTRVTHGSANWFFNWDSDFNMLCDSCCQKLIYYPKHRPKQLDKKRKRIGFGNGLRFDGTFNQRSGYCSKCPNNIFDGSCRMTNMHHLFYIIIMPWFGRVELCASCHGKETNKGKSMK